VSYAPTPPTGTTRHAVLTFLRARLPETVKAMAPLVGVICVLQFTVVQAPAAQFIQFLAGSVLSLVGMLLLFAGVEIGILPMGRFIGADLPRQRGSIALMAAVALAMGFTTTVAEPDVLILAQQVAAVAPGAPSGPALVYLVAAGVGLFAAVALLRIVHGISLQVVLALVYCVMLALSFLAPASFVSLAYDAGSVTTGVLTAPALLALSLGVSSVLAGRSAASDGFGLLGLASVGPILAVLLLGWWLR
jgi:hypothetical protein